MKDNFTKEKTRQIYGEMIEKGALVLQRPTVMRILECAVRFFMAFVLSRATILGGYMPFGVGFVAASGATIAGFCSLLGAVLSYGLSAGFLSGLKYIACSILVYAISFVINETGLRKKDFFMPTAAAAVMFCIGFVYVVEDRWSAVATACFLTEVILTGAVTYFYLIAMPQRERKVMDTRRFASILILTATVLIVFYKLTFFGIFSIGRILACIVVMLAARAGGMGAGCSAGVAIGVAMDLAYGGVPYFSMAYGFSGLFAGIFSKQNRLFFTVAYILGNAVSVLWTVGIELRTAALYEVFIASVIYMLLPVSITEEVRDIIGSNDGSISSEKTKEHVQMKLKNMSRVFRELCDVLSSDKKKSNDNDIATVFDKATEKVCRRCPVMRTCWDRDYMNTYNTFNDISGAMMSRGRVIASDFPEHFKNKCRSFSDLQKAINEEMEMMLYRRQYKNRVLENKKTVCRQYGHLAEILEGAAMEIGESLSFDPAVEKRLKKYIKQVGVEADVAVFKDSQGRLHAELEGADLEDLMEEETEVFEKLMGTRICEPEQQKGAEVQKILIAEAEPLAAIAAIASKKKKGQTVNGDSGTYFKSDKGILYVLLSDGMGSGEAAAKESMMAINLLERFLRSGIEPEPALKTLNSVFTMRGSDDGFFATMDLMCINLFSGETMLYKYGAAPSYIKRNKLVKRVKSKAVAVGAAYGEFSEPDAVKFKLLAGDFVIVVSDGISDGRDDKWLIEAAESFDGDSPSELAKLILNSSDDERNDDMTILVLRLQKRMY